EAIIHHERDTTKAIVWVWGAFGGFDGPAEGIYGVLAEELKTEITSLRVNYRHPNLLDESVMDTLAGVTFLTATGHTDIALVGHSFGGAVVISAAPFSARVKAVVALSSQTCGARNAAAVSPRPLLLVHGQDDYRLPPQCSEQIYEWAREPKELVIYPGAGHGLRQCKDELRELLKRWIGEKLNVTDS
ncbi:MAG: prolyl oligopeptidase family serine peptidase, partial [Chloroflexi bacterium]|nr:prolyl oligopeptidase family serine peptidase [Chloroflexota bacterium]